jgi:NADPH:quinone reductase-like Zn-dependent oxidoreductase
MKAMVIHRYGDADVFEFANVEAPHPRPDQVLVRVHGSSVNPLDTGIRRGMLMVQLEFPAVLGVDVSGEVVEVGENSSRFAVGERVYAYTGVGAGGGYGELAAVAEASLARVPDNLDLVAAGAVPGVGATAVEAFTVHAPIEPGMRVFINGAAGGVGTFAIQVAKALGADVTGTCSTSKADLVNSLGAQVVDYTDGDAFTQKQTYDVVLNAVRGADENQLRTLLKDGGTLVTVVRRPGEPASPTNGGDVPCTSVIPFIVNSNSACLDRLSTMIEDNDVQPIIEKTYPLAELPEAHQRVETGRVAGKVCIDVTAVWQAP